MDQYQSEMNESINTTNYEEDLMGMSEEEIDKYCIDYFTEAPIIFQARSGDQIDSLLSNYIYEMKITIPIKYIKSNLYLIGS